MQITETAYAKINLALHVRGRRDDGYHELETIFAFVGGARCGDVLTARTAQQDSVEAIGEFAGPLGNPFDNLVAKALAVLPRPAGLAITLEKNLPVAAGLGGGSADAGALFRIVRDLHGLPDNWRARASTLGADVPACVESITSIGHGSGTEIEPVTSDLTGTPILLVNPRVPLSTASVFQAWDGQDCGGLPTGSVSEIAMNGRNDLEAAAITLCPVIEEVLLALRGTGPILARMSGSGASCFALYSDDNTLAQATEKIALSNPDWWQMKGYLR